MQVKVPSGAPADLVTRSEPPFRAENNAAETLPRAEWSWDGTDGLGALAEAPTISPN
jgi:hypothetical protein